jgi:hypothetical protein
MVIVACENESWERVDRSAAGWRDLRWRIVKVRKAKIWRSRPGSLPSQGRVSAGSDYSLIQRASVQSILDCLNWHGIPVILQVILHVDERELLLFRFALVLVLVLFVIVILLIHLTVIAFPASPRPFPRTRTGVWIGLCLCTSHFLCT